MTQIKANQLEIEEILNDPLAFANETKKGTVQIATQGEVNAGTAGILVATAATVFGRPSDILDMVAFSDGSLDSITSTKSELLLSHTNNVGLSINAVGSPAVVSTTLYHDGNSTLTTVSGGVQITGILDFVAEGSPATTPQIVFPNYTTASLPATILEGGTVYDSDSKTLKFYNGSIWATFPTQLNDLTDVTMSGSPIVAEGELLTYQTGTWVNSSTVTGDLTMDTATQLFIDSGTNTNPAIAFTASTNSGMYYDSVRVKFTSAGVNVMSMADNALEAHTQVRSTIVGGITSPNYTFTAATNTGMYTAAGTDIGFTVSGTGRLLIESDGTLSVAGTTDYETLITADDDIPNKKYVDDNDRLTINAQIDSYSLVLSDENALVTMSNAVPNDLTIPTNASVAFPIGTQILVEQEGSGATTIVGTGSPPLPTIHSAGSLYTTASQYTTITLIKKATDTWLIVGDLV